MTMLGWAQAWRIARRDLQPDLRGLRLLFLCLFLGVATLAAIGSLTASITGELAGRGQVILGGDIEIAMTQREASPVEKAALASEGVLSETIRMRAMAQSVDGTAAAVLAELKGVDSAYPLYGRLAVRGASAAASAPPLDAQSILIDQAMADRLDVATGDRLRFGEADYRVTGLIADEPDRVGEGFTLGPVAIVSMDGLRRSQLIQPGSLFESKYRIRLTPAQDAAAVADQLKDRFSAAGWEIKTRDRAAPGVDRFIERMGQFLSLIGLAALVIAGIGVSNGVSSYLSGKRSGIATLKVLGAQSADIRRIYMMQIGTIAVLAILAGLVVGAIVPQGVVAIAGDVLPVQPGFALHPQPLMLSAAYGLLIALLFTLPPLARAKSEPTAALFRARVEGASRADRATLTACALIALSIGALAVASAREPLFSASVLAAIAAVLLLLFALGAALKRVASRLPRPRRPLLRLAIANLYRPGAQTPALVVALGLALTLFVTLAAIQTSLAAEIASTVPKRAPDQIVLDVPKDAEAQFRRIVSEQAPSAQVAMVATLRGTITAYGEQRVADLKTLPDGAWFLRGERGVTYSASVPEGSELTAGQWWPRDYAGPPLVSLDEEAAGVLGIGVGDNITVSILGREITARIASLRKVNWDTMGFNYILVFPPATLASAPHSLAATISLPDERIAPVSRALLSTFPAISVIAVGEVIGQVSGLLDQMAMAILAAASVAILAGVAVLIGAIAAARESRAYDSVIMKTLGATRWQILGAQALEYGLLAAVLAAVALGIGTAGAWFVIVQIFQFDWAPDWPIILATLGGGAVLTLGIGLIGSIPLMGVRPAQALRQL